MAADIVTMEGECVCYLSSGAISNDRERTLIPFSRSHHSLTLYISQTATDRVRINVQCGLGSAGHSALSEFCSTRNLAIANTSRVSCASKVTAVNFQQLERVYGRHV